MQSTAQTPPQRGPQKSCSLQSEHLRLEQNALLEQKQVEGSRNTPKFGYGSLLDHGFMHSNDFGGNLLLWAFWDLQTSGSGKWRTGYGRLFPLCVPLDKSWVKEINWRSHFHFLMGICCLGNRYLEILYKWILAKQQIPPSHPVRPPLSLILYWVLCPVGR